MAERSTYMEKLRARNDAWTEEADKSLANIVLSHIRKRKSQLTAFEEASRILGRTFAACGFRWNGVLRKRYDAAIKQAKNESIGIKVKYRKSTADNEFPITETVTPHAAMRNIIRFLENRDSSYQQLVQKIQQLEKERELLLAQVADLESKQPNDTKPITTEQAESDEEILTKILERWKFRELNTEAE